MLRILMPTELHRGWGFHFSVLQHLAKRRFILFSLCFRSGKLASVCCVFRLLSFSCFPLSSSILDEGGEWRDDDGKRDECRRPLAPKARARGSSAPSPLLLKALSSIPQIPGFIIPLEVAGIQQKINPETVDISAVSSNNKDFYYSWVPLMNRVPVMLVAFSFLRRLCHALLIYI